MPDRRHNFPPDRRRDYPPDSSQMGRHPNRVQLPGMTAPPPEQPAKKEEVGWVCSQCTLINPPRRPSCETCLCDRPKEYVVPDDAPLDEATRKAQESEMMFEEVS